MMSSCKETQKYLEHRLPDWTFKVGQLKTTMVTGAGDMLAMGGCNGRDEQTLYKAAIRFGYEQMCFRNDPVIQDLERQIEERKEYLRKQPTVLVKKPE